MIARTPEDRAAPTAGAGANGFGATQGRSMLQWAASFLENAPALVAIVRREDYRVVYTNIACQRAYPMPASPAEPAIGDVFAMPVARTLEALVDDGAVPGLAPGEAIVMQREGQASLHCLAWPLADGEDPATPLVIIEMCPAVNPSAEAERALHVSVAQRLVLSALHEQMRAEASAAAEKVAQAATAAKDTFLTTMSHELRTPLNAIGGYAELIELGLRGPTTAAQREDLGRIQRAQVHLVGLINSVLNFSKLKSGSVHFDLKTVGLEASLDAVLDMVMPQITRKGLVYLELDDAPRRCDEVMVKADPEKLRQILINLLTNAIKFTATGGTISATCNAEGDRAIVRIRDTGRGIPAEELPRIFDPFVQVGRKLSSNDQGVGLGLSISRDLARGMGGDLTATSVLDEGSTFTLTLKRVSRDEQPSP